MKVFRSPQEKKKLSLQKDRRSFARSKKSIPRNKRFANRKLRRSASTLAVLVSAGTERADVVEGRVLARTRLAVKGRWKKYADQPLEQHIEDRLKARLKRYGRRKWPWANVRREQILWLMIHRLEREGNRIWATHSVEDQICELSQLLAKSLELNRPCR